MRAMYRAPGLASRWTILIAVLVLAATPAIAQKKSVDCSPHRGISRSDEVSDFVDAGRTLCEEAEAALGEAKALYDRADDLRKSADRFRKSSERERKAIEEIRDDIEDRRKAIDRLRAESHELELQAELLRADRDEAAPPPVAQASDGAASPISARSDADSSFEPAAPRAAALASYRDARLRFIEARRAGIQEEIDALEGMNEVDDDLATDREVSVVDYQQLALNNERTAIDAEAAARAAEDVATQAETQAILQHVRASTAFIRLHLNDEGSRRNVNRAIDYIEEHFLVLPPDLATEVNDLLAQGRAAFNID